LNRGNFIGTFTKTGAKSQGTFFAGDNRATAKRLTPFLEAAFAYAREGLPSQWRIGGAEGGFVFMNNGVEALIRVLSDFVDHVKAHEGVDPLIASTEEVVETCEPLLDAVVEHISGLTTEEGAGYRKLYGTGGAATYYHRLQLAVRDARSEFNPVGLDEWVKAQDRHFVTEATSIVQDVEHVLKSDVRSQLEDEYGSDWWREGVPRSVRKKTGETMLARNLDRASGEQLEEWDCMYLVDYNEVLAYSHDVWQRRFEKRYTKPGDEQLAGTWKRKLDWIKDLSDIRNDLTHSRGISEENYAFLTELNLWLVLAEVDNDL
jgi:DNA sulfur modification protein DndB